MRSFLPIIVLIVFVGGLGVVFVVAGRQAERTRALRSSAEQLGNEARQMQNSAARLRASPDVLNSEERGAEAQALDEKAAELLNEAAFLRQTQPIPVARMAAEYTEKAQALSDSAARIRADLQVRQGSINPLQAGLLAGLEANARQLQTQARLLGQEASSAGARVELFNSCVLIYGKGTNACDQLRGNATPPPAVTP